MTKIIKKLLFILLLSGMICSVIPVSANESLGSITIILEDTTNELSKENVEFGLTKVADIINGEYVSLEEYSYFDFNNIENANELKDTSKRLNKIISSNDAIDKTNEEGILKFEGLEVGIYLLHPTYIADYEIIEPTLVSIPAWEETSGEMNYNVFVYPKHEPLPTIRINKVDSITDKTIINKAFEFTLYTDNSCSNVLEILNEVNNDGIIDFDITYGTYFLKETEAPNGYQLSDKVIKIEFNDEGVFFNGVLAKKEDGVYIFEYENKQIPTPTPDTSDNSNMIIWYIIIAISILIPSLYLIAEDKNNDKK